MPPPLIRCDSDGGANKSKITYNNMVTYGNKIAYGEVANLTSIKNIQTKDNTEDSDSKANDAPLNLSFSCDICGLYNLCEVSYNQHIEGKRHKRAFNKSSSTTTNTNLRTKAPKWSHQDSLDSKPTKERSIKHKSRTNTSATISTKKPVVYSCKHCNINGLDSTSYAQHLQGRKHKLNLQKKKDNSASIGKVENETFPCDVCSVIFQSFEEYLKHSESKSHEIMVENPQGYYCQPCDDVILGGDEGVMSHIKDIMHKLNVKNFEKKSKKIESKSESEEKVEEKVEMKRMKKKKPTYRPIVKIKRTGIPITPKHKNAWGVTKVISSQTMNKNNNRSFIAQELQKYEKKNSITQTNSKPIVEKKEMKVLLKETGESPNLETTSESFEDQNSQIDRECSICYEQFQKEDSKDTFKCKRCNIRLHGRCWRKCKESRSRCPNCQRHYW
eukprot:TRINITY_DN3457_c0_g5_i1.p1 TRINITY_DN3457_c0_g5~~TRINITY_DN3457_c0_g5_i1.p1  ORF type:complete len:498 (+),score=127.05 TRINITY_DN3457_c0_g5_i1:168-1496(+)